MSAGYYPNINDREFDLLKKILENTGWLVDNGGGGGSLPPQTGHAGQFLTTDGSSASWSTVSGTGTVTSVSVVTANGVSATVATSTTTPALTFALGDITPTSVSTSGSISTGVGGSTAGVLKLGQGTAPSTGTTNISLAAPASVTSYIRIFEGSAGSTGLYLGTVSGTTVTDSKTGVGTGVLTALAINTGSAGAFQVNNASGASLTSLTAANISTGALANGMTATTQSAGDNSTKLATTAYADVAGRAANLGTFASPNTAAGAITWTAPVYQIYTSAGSTRTYTLPAASSYTGQAVVLFVAVGTGHVNFQPASGAQLVLAGVLLTANHYIQCATSAPGNYLLLVSDGTNWVSWGSSGTWTDAASA